MFDVDSHLVTQSHRSNSNSDSGLEDLDLDTVIPTGASMDVHFKVIDNTPGLAVKTQNTQLWTLIATRTRWRSTLAPVAD